jgi:photosystem II stability/assembly factor-like uncharacterized protein
LPGTVSYFVGNDPKQWRTEIPTYSRVRRKGIYPGVDLVYYGNQQQLEYDFIVAPGVDPGRIRLAFTNAERLSLDASGDLIVKTAAGELRQHAPTTYQEVNGIRRETASRYVLRGKHRVGFSVGRCDHKRPLVIDPVLVYSTYFGGDSTWGTAITVDREGNTYVAGGTCAINFPTTSGAFQRVKPSGDDLGDEVFVTKLNATGTAVLYSTFIGGQQDDDANGVAVDTAGNAYVTGITGSSDFPVTPGAFQTKPGKYNNAFVLKLNPRGTALSYSTFLGGSDGTQGNAIAIDGAGNAYVAGKTQASDFPVTPKAFQTSFGRKGIPTGSSAFVTKLNPTGSALIYSTYLGVAEGNDYDAEATGIAVDTAGNAYVTGENSAEFPTTYGAYVSTGFLYDNVFITKLSADGSALVYSSLFGGGDGNRPNAIAIDSSGCAYITGETTSLDFPTVNPMQGKIASGGFIASRDGGSHWASLDGGIGWNSQFDVDRTADTIALDPQSPSTLYVGTFTLGNPAILKSTDGGLTFVSNSSPRDLPNRLNAIIVDPASANRVYAGAAGAGVPGGGGVYLSTDGGTSWALSGPSFANDKDGVLSFAFDPQNASIIYAGTTSGFYKSSDSASSWTRLDSGLADANFNAIAIDPGHSTTIYAGTNNGLLKSQDGGHTWRATTVTHPVGSAAIDGVNTDTVYAGVLDQPLSATGGDGRGNPRRRIQGDTSLEGMVKSTDGGATWKSINNGFIFFSFNYVITFDPIDHSTLYVATSDGLFKTTDGGAHWTVNQTARFWINTVAVAPTSPPTVYAATDQSSDAFVAKMDPTGSSLVYSTYLGGISVDAGLGIAVDAQGNAFVVGRTFSSDFPSTADGVQPVYAGDQSGGDVGDAFLVKLGPTGSILYSTFMGGDQDDLANAVAVDSGGNVFVTGEAGSPNFPTINAIQPSLDIPSACDAFIAKFAESFPSSSGMFITTASVPGDSLIVKGQGFGPGAVIMLNGRAEPSDNDPVNPGSNLISKKAAKRIPPGGVAILQVRNPDGGLSREYLFYRPGE